MKPQCDKPCLHRQPCTPSEDRCPLSRNLKKLRKIYICEKCGKNNMPKTIEIPLERLRKEWEMWNTLAEKYRNKVVMTPDEHVFIKTAQEMRNAFHRILCGQFKGESTETIIENVEKVLESGRVR